MKVALIRLDDGSIVETFDRLPHSVKLPGVGSVDGAGVGWHGGGQLTYMRTKAGKEIAVEGPAQFAIVAVEEAAPPPKGQRVAARRHERVGDAVREVATYEPIPAVTECSAEEKLRATGLTVPELKTLLGL